MNKIIYFIHFDGIASTITKTTYILMESLNTPNCLTTPLLLSILNFLQQNLIYF
jgi:hypothetical protein